MDLYNRGGFSQGYYKERNGRDMIAISRPNHAGVPAARVLSQKGRELTVETLADIHKGDLLELNLQRENYSFGKEIPKGTKTMILVPKKEQYQKGQVLNRIRNQKLMTEMKNSIWTGNKRAALRISACVSGRTGNVNCLDGKCKCDGLYRTGSAGGTESADGGVQNPKAAF